MSEIEEIKNQIKELEKLILRKFEELNKKIDNMNDVNTMKINMIEHNCKKMGSHIDFIEEAYNTVQKPLNFIKNSVDKLIGNESKELPQLENKNL